MPGIEGGDKVGFDEVATAGQIDHRGALGQAREQAGIEDAPRRSIQRQQTDEDIGARQKGEQTLGARIAVDPFEPMGAAGLRPATRNPTAASRRAASRPNTPMPMTPTRR